MTRFRLRESGDGFFYPEIELLALEGPFWRNMMFEGKPVRYEDEVNGRAFIESELRRRKMQREYDKRKRERDFGRVVGEWSEE